MTVQNARDDLYGHYAETRRELMAAIEGLSEAQLLEASIDGWSIKDHLAHLCFWDEVRASEIERISAGRGPIWPLITEQQTETLNALVRDMRRSLTLEQVRAELAASRQKVRDAIANATERGLDASLYAEAGLRSTHELGHAGYIRAWRQRLGL